MNLRHDNRVEIVREHEVQKKNCNIVSTLNHLGLEKLKIGDHSEEKVEKVQTEDEAALIRKKRLESLQKNK